MDAHLATSDRWQAQAACRGLGPALFFASEDNNDVARAKAICVTCEVRVSCLQCALAERELLGVWDGTPELERRRIARQQRCGVSLLGNAGIRGA